MKSIKTTGVIDPTAPWVPVSVNKGPNKPQCATCTGGSGGCGGCPFPDPS